MSFVLLKMRSIIPCLLFFLSAIKVQAQKEVEILIKGGRILDGTGNPWFYGDVAIKNGKIIKVGDLDDYRAAKTIEAKGMIVSPGFIDVHTHIEGNEIKNPTADNFILDGVTTVVTGNCGASNVDVKSYLQQLDSLQISINVATLIGHNDVRRAVMGTANRNPTADEQTKMEAHRRKK